MHKITKLIIAAILVPSVFYGVLFYLSMTSYNILIFGNEKEIHQKNFAKVIETASKKNGYVSEFLSSQTLGKMLEQHPDCCKVCLADLFPHPFLTESYNWVEDKRTILKSDAKPYLFAHLALWITLRSIVGEQNYYYVINIPTKGIYDYSVLCNANSKCLEAT
ncbi:hypothetical protein [Lentilitoribacter sp. Alg239-R112]|uniref:hypothetical protein n=1 Tax=Lentilitoribacter sp. Alg239-R112 TaxID=2305987 RepID=UPI0013A6B0F1|nr:hypothetical protein [Lentilitoribacter sp. Alg239-R112]